MRIADLKFGHRFKPLTADTLVPTLCVGTREDQPIGNMEFEWDPNKAAKNFRKHRVPFSEAATIFGDTLAITVPDSDHSLDEDHCITVGWSNRFRLLMVAHTGLVHRFGRSRSERGWKRGL